MPSTMRVVFQIVLALCACMASGVLPGSALAADSDRPPAEVFDHLEQQRDALATAAADSGAKVVSLPGGGFEVRNSDARGSGAWHNGARRPLEPTSIRFEAADGAIVFSFAGYGDVRVVPVKRQAPSLIAHDRNAVTAYDVDHKLDEFTVASHALLEQHLVIASEFANNKLIEYSYAIIPPFGASVDFANGQISVRQGGQLLVAMRADYAMDEAGTRLPATLSFDAASSVATVTYDGRPLNPQGDVAIDPVLLSEGDVGIYVMKVCQGPSGSVCDVQPVCAEAPTDPCHLDGLPPGIGGSTLGNFQIGATPQWGLYVSAMQGSIGIGHFGRITYTPPVDTKIRKVVFHGRIDDATREFSCRTELIKDGSVHGEPGPWFTVLASESNRLIKTEAEAPVNANGDPIDADQAALRFQMTGNGGAVSQDHASRCWMPDATVDQNDQAIADRFSAFIHDLHPPTVSASPDLENPATDALNVVSGVTGTSAANWVTNDHQYNTNRWYRSGSRVTFALYGEDRGSGLFGFRVRHVSEDGPTNTMGLIGTCPIAAHNTSEAPCPLKPGLTFGSGYLTGPGAEQPNSVHQGLNPYWVVAEDFSGRSRRAGPMFYLFDSVPPSNPNPSATATNEATATVVDATTSVRLSWEPAQDPGEAPTGRRTGSGISHYVAQVEWKQNGQWQPYTATSEVIAGDTDPMTFAAPPTHVDIDAATGLFRYRVRSVDRAGNTSAWAVEDYRYFWVDTTEPEIRLSRPTVGFEVDVRMPDQAPKLTVELADPVTASMSDPVIDRAGVEYRVDGASAFSEHVDRAGLAPASFNSSKSFPTPGLYDVRGFARDGAHHSFTGQVQVCADTAISAADSRERAIGAEYFPFYEAGVQYATRIRFTPPSSSVQATAWIIERMDASGPWRLVRRVGHRPGQQLDIDDWTPATSATRWRISPAVLDCTDEGHADIAEPVAQGAGVVDPPTRSQTAALLGLERHWSYHELPLGGGTSSYTNIATGNLIVQRSLLSEAGRGLSTNVDLTYNSHQYGDDDQLARDGIVGAHFTLAVGNSSAATTGGLHIAETSITLRDGDGTPLVFTRPASSWDGYFQSPKGVRMLARDLEALPDGHPDKSADGFVGTRFKISRPDGVTYYYGDDDVQDPSAPSGLRRGRLIGIRDREDDTTRKDRRLTFVYECVAVADLASGGVSVTPLVKSESGWKKGRDAAGTVTDRCPSMDVRIAGLPSSSVRRMRLVQVRDGAWTPTNGREVFITYRDEDGPLDGHIAEIRGHLDKGARSVRFAYGIQDGTVQLRTITDVARDGSQRSIDLSYDASLDDPYDWFDDDVLLKSVDDLRNNQTRFRYTVPDGAGITHANPRIALIENREDVAVGDERGVAFRYTTDADGMLAGRTRVDDQLDRRTTYDWSASLDAPSAFGRVTSSLDPSGLRTTLAWTDENQVKQVSAAADRVQDEPVAIVGSGPAMLRNGAADPAAPVRVLRAGSGFDVSSQYVVDWDAGTIGRAQGAPADSHVVLVSYTPARVGISTYEYDGTSGRVTRVVGDQGWTRTPDGTTRGNVAGPLGMPTAHDSPATTLAYTQSAGAPRVASFVQDLHQVRTPLGHTTGGHDTTLTVDSRTGRVQVVHAPYGSGQQHAPTWSSYYPNGDLRSTTDAQGWTIAYWDYDEAGRARQVSRRFNAGAVPGFAEASSEAAVGALGLPHAFHVDYDPDGQIECVRDLRGGPSRGNRFTTYRYDAFGRIVAETAPFRTDGNRRLRRLTTHSYDANGNLVHSVRNRLYYLAGTSGDADDCEHVPSDPDAGVSVPGGKPDVEYDRLDRATTERLLANSDSRDERARTTTYNRAGDVTRVVEPRGNATAVANDYSTRLVYDGAGRVIERIDGEERRACLYYDAWSNVAMETSPRFQGATPCPPAADQGRSTRRMFDDSGHVVWEQQPSGQTSLTLYDAEGNPGHVRVAQREREGAAETLSVQTTTRITRSTYGVGGLLLEQESPNRAVCTAAGLTGCSDTGRVSRAPRHTWTYNELGRLVAERLPRQLGETGAGLSQPIRYQYDEDGNRIAEITPHGSDDSDVSAVYTSYDEYGNPRTVTTPVPLNMPVGALRTKFTTNFSYQDDDSPASKLDRAHDNSVSWEYERNGQMSMRIEHGLGTDPDDQWRTEQRYGYYDDASLRTAPYTVQVFQPNATYVTGTCLRAGGSNSTTPTHVYQVASPKRVARARTAPNWNDPTWSVGDAEWTGEVRLIKRHFSSGALHTYDENGQPKSVVGCGVRTDWLERNGVGQPTVARDIHGGYVNYRYGPGGELLDERVGERIYRTGYLEPDSDPATLDPGAGQVDIARLITPSENTSELKVGYTYALDGSVDQLHRYRRGRYAGDFAVAGDVVSMTSYDYDAAGQLETQQTVRYATAAVAARTRNPNAARPPVAMRGVRGSGVAQLVHGQRLTRDLAGNPRWIGETQRMAESARVRRLRSREKLYAYDLAQRLVQDRVASSPVRTYAHDAFGRLDTVRAGSAFLDRYFYDEGSRSLGVMLPARQQSRDDLQDPLRLSVLEYGNGRRQDAAGSEAGPRGQLVSSTRYAGLDAASGVEHVTSYAFTSLNQLARATDTTYRASRGRTNRGRGVGRRVAPRASSATSVQSEWTHYDLLGRRVALVQSADDPATAAEPAYTSTAMVYAGASQDPFAEVSTNPNDPDTRWIHRVGGAIVGEVRNSRSRYMLADQQASTIATLDASPASQITATFDYASYGKPRDPEAIHHGPALQRATRNLDSFASGLAKERAENSYSYTGMRHNAVGATTHHHARDYNATLRGWIQTDQYMDPWSDVALSLNPATRDRHAYVNYNPIGMVDPWGHDGCSPLVAPVACAPGTDQNPDTGNAGGGGACRCTAEGQPHPGGTAGRAPGGSGNGATRLDAGETWLPQPVRIEARESTAPIVVDAPSLPLDQRISAELDRRADPYVGPFVDAASEGDLVGGCVSPGYSTKRGIPFVRPKGLGGELIVCITNVDGDWAVPISLSGGPGGGGGASFTAGPIFTNAQKTSGVGGWSVGGGASVQAGPLPAVVNVDYGYGPSGKTNTVFVGFGPGRGAEYHQRTVYTWTPGGGG